MPEDADPVPDLEERLGDLLHVCEGLRALCSCGQERGLTLADTPRRAPCLRPSSRPNSVGHCSGRRRAVAIPPDDRAGSEVLPHPSLGANRPKASRTD